MFKNTNKLLCASDMRHILLILGLLSFSLNVYANEVSLNHDGLSISVTFKDVSKPKNEDSHVLYGTLKVSNKTDKVKSYSNKNLLLTINDLQARTYKNTVASVAIDFTDIQLQLNEQINHKVYWVFKHPVSTIKSKVSLQWAQ